MARAAQLSIGIFGLPDTPQRHVSVDGMTPVGPNLSHWPGNRTPREFKADLTTGIALAFARAPRQVQAEFLAGAEAVVNDHYDTDGFLAMLALVRPEVALAREEVCLAAAATGDYQAFTTERAFAIDRIVQNLPKSPASPLAPELATIDAGRHGLVCYRWLIEHAERVLERPETLRPLWEPELLVVRQGLGRAKRGEIERRFFHDARLAVVRSRGALHRMVVNTVAGGFRVLHVIETDEGPQYRYHDRTESWFEVVSFAPPPRRDLRVLREHLAYLERAAGPGQTGQWCADPPELPVPELYHGIPAAQEYGQVTRILTPSRLSQHRVEREVRQFLARA